MMNWSDFWECVSSCKVCGALVYDEQESVHLWWHVYNDADGTIARKLLGHGA